MTVAEISSFQLETIEKFAPKCQRDSEYYRGSSEPSSYYGRIYPCEGTDRKESEAGGCVCSEL